MPKRNIEALSTSAMPRTKTHVYIHWLTLPQDEPEDFVIATGLQYSVREFIPRTPAS